jgi:hypothetical protein
MIKKEDLIRLGKETLPLILEKKGELIYSSHETLKKGDVYLMGLNPGGKGFITIKEHLEKMLQNEENAYLDQCWDNRVSDKIPKGQAPLQRRVNYLLSELGYNTRDICATNLIFATSRSADDINYGLAGYCWRFHQKILNIIQPKLILCFGISSVSSYSFLLSLYDGKELTPFPSGHGKWECRAFTTKMDGRTTHVVGIPHLSYYSIIGRNEVIDWIKSFL